MEESRYFHDEVVQRFINGLLTSAQERTIIIREGQGCWRAQLGCDEDPIWVDGEIVDYNAVPFPGARMIPLRDRASEGRVNAKGIPCLYLSKEQRTAICEVRPWVGAHVTVAQFRTLRDLKLVDCQSDIDPVELEKHLDELYKLQEPDAEETTLTVWRHINHAFSKPVDRNDYSAEYAPTQVIAELFKANGFDGIAYTSVFNAGSNMALFDLDSARQVGEERLVQLTGLDVAYREKAASQVRWQKHTFEKR